MKRLSLFIYFVFIVVYANAIEIVVHRGANALAPENTIASADSALKYGATWIEVDVRTTKDSVLFNLHDETLDRTTNGKGKLVDMLSDDVRKLDAGAWFSPKYKGTPIPTISDMLDHLQGKANVFFDVKRGTPVAKLVKLVRDKGYADKSFFWFGDEKMLKEFIRLAPEMKIKVNAATIDRLKYWQSICTPSYVEIAPEKITPEFTAYCHSYGIKVMAACQEDDTSQFPLVIEKKADMVNLDRPEVFVKLLNITYVDPCIGSEGEGRTFVGPSAPFGMVKPGPDCVSMPNAGWAPMPEAVKGFSQTHVSGTGGGQKYGNVLIQPINQSSKAIKSDLLLPNGTITSIPLYCRHRQKEEISLGYYSCTYDNGIKTEITTAPRCAIYRFTGANALYIDVASFLGMDTIPNKREAQQYVGSDVKVTGKNEVCGRTTVRGGWNNGGPYTVYFCLQSEKPLNKVEVKDSLWCLVSLDSLVSQERLEPLATVKVGISYVSIDQARRNISPLSFDAQLDNLRSEWNRMLAKVPYKGTAKEMRVFYTALYHTLLMPVDKTIGKSPYFDDYYAIWDTYRTSFPLLMEYYPDVAVKMINSLLNIYKHEGYMPDARSGDCNGRTQGGSNAEVVIAEAFARGLKGIDYELALKAMIKDAEVPPADDEKEGRGGLKEYNNLGYIPYGIPRAGTRTIEYSYDDWCIAQVAKGLGHKSLYKKYLKRSSNWQNLWRADYEWQGMRGFIMPRDAKGRWLDSVPWGKSKVFHPMIPYKPDTKVAPWYIPWWNTFFYEALSAEYSLAIPHDIPTLIKFCGGDSVFRKRLDTFFDNGHYNVGNEPSFLTPYLFSYIGRTDLASKRVSQIVNKYFNDKPTGLPGNDDSGAMSAWLIWAMLGKYPVAGQGKFITITPVRLAGAGLVPALTTVHFTLNRQYRNWDLSYEYRGDTLVINCHDNLYITPKQVLEHAKGFCWDSPQNTGNTYNAMGTFLFISKDALKSLQTKGLFFYDGIKWRKIDEKGNLIHVKADVDNTEMWIDYKQDIPIVLKMEGNPLGINWRIK